MSINIEAWVRRSACREHVKVTSAVYHFVALDGAFKPRPVPPEDAATHVDAQ
jgi:acyl-CoA hydrolase